jgi:hypothetical protein
MENEFGIIKINYDIFIKILRERENKESELPQTLINKSNELQNTYNCFASNYDARSLWEKKKYIATKIRNKESKNFKAKPITIISSDFSDETKYKKEFTGYLNKLTDINKQTIYSKILIFISKINTDIIPSLFDIIWDFIKKSSNNIYIDIIYLFDANIVNNNLTNMWNKFINNKEWKLDDKIANKEILLNNNNNNYDEFCEYVKWKKSNISIIRTWCYIFKKEKKLENIDIILYNLIELINQYIIYKNMYKHVIDIALDQLYAILDIYNNTEIINIIKSWNIEVFEKSSKFKIFNILEKYNL